MVAIVVSRAPGRQALVVGTIAMLLRVHPSVLEAFAATPDRANAPVRPYPQTWSISGVMRLPRYHLFVLTEEFSFVSLLITTAPTAQLGDLFAAIEDRLLYFLETRRYFQPAQIFPVTVVTLEDKRLLDHQGRVAEAVQRFQEHQRIVPSAERIAELEWQVNCGPASSAIQKKLNQPENTG